MYIKSYYHRINDDNGSYFSLYFPVLFFPRPLTTMTQLPRDYISPAGRPW
jgi:hypothetical protein